MGLINATLRRITKERTYAAAAVLCWLLAFVLSTIITADGGVNGSESLPMRDISDIILIYLIVLIPVCTYVFGKNLQSRTVALELCAGFSRLSILISHALELIVALLVLCLSSTAIVCLNACGYVFWQFGTTPIRIVALICACTATVSPVCLALALSRDVLRSVVASALIIFAEAWSMAIAIRPFISAQGDLSLDIPNMLLLNPVVVVKMAFFSDIGANQLASAIGACIGFSAAFFCIALVIWRLCEFR